FELADMFKVKIETMDDVIFYAKKLKEMGAVNVLVSLAEHGSVLLDEFENIHIMKAIKGDVVNSVGAGDSMLAGFIAGYLEKQNYDYALKLGTASGAATAFSAGLAEKAEIYKMLEKLV
ncbi:MAG: 1-phosphofructokinase, partial [Clostridiales bacterium]|nr:1-phosphofructokinase [Clostridiales bacterium]